MKQKLIHLLINTDTEQEILELYQRNTINNDKTLTITPNLDIFRLSWKDSNISKIINSATYCTIDGKPLIWIAKWLKIKELNNKISGSDLATDLLPIMNEQKNTLFLFGGKEGVALKAKEKINKVYPNIRVVGVLCPEFGYEKNEELCLEYVSIINSAKPQYVFLCTSFPKSETFFYNHKDELINANYLCVGATIDFFAGTIQRAPKWMSKVGLEWLYRLSKDFRRLFKRYFLDGFFLIKMYFLCHFKRKEIRSLYDNDCN